MLGVTLSEPFVTIPTADHFVTTLDPFDGRSADDTVDSRRRPAADQYRQFASTGSPGHDARSLQTNRMPGGLKLGRVKNPIRIFGFLVEPIADRQGMIRVTLQVQR